MKRFLPKMLKIVTLAGIVTLVVAACGGGAPTATAPPAATATPRPTATAAAPTPTTAALPTATAVAPTPTPTPFVAVGQPKYGGTFRTAAGSLQPQWDEHLNPSPAGIRDISRILFNGVVRFDQRSSSPQPDLAESWTIDSGGDVIFKIRKGVRFHNKAPVNGRELTADDVKWSMDRAKTHPKSILKTRFATLEEVQVIDASTIKFVMTQSDANLLFHLGFEQVVIFAQEAAIDEAFSDPRSQIGSGPFVADLMQNPGQSRFLRNPNYWRQDAEGRQVPYLDSIEYLAGSDAAVVAALLKTQELDLAAIRTSQDVAYFAGQAGANIQDTTGVLVGNWGLFFNVTIAPFNDKRLREAVHLLIIRQDLIDIAYGGLAYLSGPLGANASLGHWSVDQLATFPGLRPDKTADVARAKQLLADAGVPNGFSFNVSHRGAEFSDEAKIYVQELARYGIEMKSQSTQNSSYERTEFAADKQSTWVTEGGGTTPDHSISNTFLRGSPKNASNWYNDAMEALYLKQLATSDKVERFKLIDQAQQMIWDDVTAAWGVRPTTAWVSWDWVKNFATPDHGYQLRAAQIDEIWIDRG